MTRYTQISAETKKHVKVICCKEFGGIQQGGYNAMCLVLKAPYYAYVPMLYNNNKGPSES